MQRKYLGEQISRGPIYRPDHSVVWQSRTSHVKLIDETTHARVGHTLDPKCIQNERRACNYQIRKALRANGDAQNQSTVPLGSSRINGSVGDAQREQQSKPNAATLSPVKTDAVQGKHYSSTRVSNLHSPLPMDKRYESQKMGVCNLKFEL